MHLFSPVLLQDYNSVIKSAIDNLKIKMEPDNYYGTMISIIICNPVVICVCGGMKL